MWDGCVFLGVEKGERFRALVFCLLFVFENGFFAVAYSVDKTNGDYASHWCQPLVVRVSSTGVAAFFCLFSPL